MESNETGTWQWALTQLETGVSVRRNDWGYSTQSAIILLESNMKVKNFFITNTMGLPENDLIGYGLTYNDIISNNWEQL